MDIHKHPNTNHVFGAPGDMTYKECAPLPVIVFKDEQGLWAQSFWKPTAEELAMLNDGKAVGLQLRIGSRDRNEPAGHPVVLVGVTPEATEPAPMPGPCTRGVVKCTLVHPDGRRWEGENWVRNHQPVCPRGSLPSGVGYEMCRDICQQVGHAEVVAARAAGDNAAGCTAYVEGHTYACDDCKSVLASVGVHDIVIGAPPEVA